MNCTAFEDRIARYVGGDLTAEEALTVTHHLRVCADCATLTGELEEDRLWLSSRPPEVNGVDFGAIRREIRRGVSAGPGWRKWLPAMLAAAAILLAVGVGITRRGTVLHGRGPVAPLVAERSPGAVEDIAPVARVEKASVAAERPIRLHQAEMPAPLTLEAAMRLFRELEPEPEPPPTGSDSPVEMRIATRDPNVTIILLQESNGDSQ